jgi:RNA polymerase sigma-70 factor (ECF subfamily)
VPALPLPVTPLERRELSDCLARLADGDRGAFDAVFRLAYPEVRAFAARHLGSADADDVAQQALVALFARVDEYDPSRDGLAWALGITAWEVRSQRRRAVRRREGGAVPELACAAATPEHHAIDAELRASLAALLDALRPHDAEALLASAGLGPRPAVPAATFRKRLERAVTRLRAAWRRCHGVD